VVGKAVLRDGAILRLRLGSTDDEIGTAGPLQPIGHAGLNKPTYMSTQGQIKSAEITFRPLN
jgi:hypothetical protein